MQEAIERKQTLKEYLKEIETGANEEVEVVKFDRKDSDIKGIYQAKRKVTFDVVADAKSKKNELRDMEKKQREVRNLI